MTNRQDIYTRVTERIVTALEQGTPPWIKPWVPGQGAGPAARPLRHNGEPYRGINVLLLWAEAMAKGYQSSHWLTYRQTLELDAHVRQGEKATMVVYANRVTRTALDEAGDEIEEKIPFLKGYSVFNADQVEGLPERFYARARPVTETAVRIDHAERFFHNTGAVTVHGGSQACYIPRHDRIHLPCIDVFKDAESYYATRAHEATHWTMHPTRLARDFGAKRFGDHGYAVEELVAELGAAFLCADLGFALEPREDHAAYLTHWLEILKADKRAIFTAASHAQRACDYLHGLQPGVSPDGEAVQ